MLKKLKSMFRSRTPPAENPVRVIGRFDAAQTTRDNIRHWAMADYLSADQEANPEIRKTLRMRSRYEVANNSYAKGLVQMLANDTIGTGPRIQLLTEDEHYNDEIEREFMAWAEAIRLPQKLRMMRVSSESEPSVKSSMSNRWYTAYSSGLTSSRVKIRSMILPLWRSVMVKCGPSSSLCLIIQRS